MINDKVIAPHIIRLYVWALLQQQINLQKVGELVPIIPIEQEPKIATSGKIYAVYGYAENTSNSMDQIHEGIFSLRVCAPTSSELGQFISVVTRAFESTDIATEGLNRYSTQFPNNALEGIRFTMA